MNEYILITAPVAVTVILTLIFLGVGFCVLQLLLQQEVIKSRRLKDRNTYLREQLSITQQELYSKTFRMPEAEDV